MTFRPCAAVICAWMARSLLAAHARPWSTACAVCNKKLERLYQQQLQKHLKRSSGQVTAAMPPHSAQEGVPDSGSPTGPGGASATGGTAQQLSSVTDKPPAVDSGEAPGGSVTGATPSSPERTAVAAEEAAPVSPSLTAPETVSDHGSLRVVAGTFGNRQGLRMSAACGPFTHTFAM